MIEFIAAIIGGLLEGIFSSVPFGKRPKDIDIPKGVPIRYEFTHGRFGLAFMYKGFPLLGI